MNKKITSYQKYIVKQLMTLCEDEDNFIISNEFMA